MVKKVKNLGAIKVFDTPDSLAYVKVSEISAIQICVDKKKPKTDEYRFSLKVYLGANVIQTRHCTHNEASYNCDWWKNEILKD